METICGYVDHILFKNKENSYMVFVLISEEEEITCTGICPQLSEGENLEVTGAYKDHSVYGPQFQIERYEVKPMEDLMSLERYLGSGAIRGVGAALAARIVRRFKKETLRILEEEPERLAEVKGISSRIAREIGEQVEEKRELRQAMIFLQQYGVSNAMSVKIFEQYGAEMYTIVKENPYRLAEDITGVGFRIADEIARKSGIEADSEFRMKSGLMHTLLQAILDGHIYLPKPVLFSKTQELLEIWDADLEKELMDLAIERKVVLWENNQEVCVYGAQYYYMELHVAKMIQDLNISGEIQEQAVLEKLQRIEEMQHTTLDEIQKQAVVEASRRGLMILTGGPGTGKTTTINMMIRYFEMEGMEISLAAPTGRAAKRMTEATGMEAQTIHRLLELTGLPEEKGGKIKFDRNEENPLESDVIIIDEMSMVDLFLMHALLLAVTPGTRLILVGDTNQLPSVGPGSILKDMIESECCKVVRLTRIFRQAEKSDIVVNAHRINRGEHIVLDNKSMDFFFLQRQDADTIIRVMLTLIVKKLPKYVDAEPTEIQVLTPMRKGLLGVERLNKILQQYLNSPKPGKQEKEYGTICFREGDKVMQVKNNYQLEWEVQGRYGIAVSKGTGVFNGDMGMIREINTIGAFITVEFDENRFAQYSFSMLDELEHAYAITIHKSQGSEYPAVVIPVMNGPRMLMNRNLLYTAITRARKCVTLVGVKEVFDQMIDQNDTQIRYTALKQRIREMGSLNLSEGRESQTK